MRNPSINKTIKHSFSTIIAISIILVVTFSFTFTVSIYRKKSVASFNKTVGYIGRNVSWEVSSITRLMDIIFIDNNVKQLLDTKTKSEYQEIKEKENIDHILNDNILNSSFNYLREVEILKGNQVVYSYLHGEISDIINMTTFIEDGIPFDIDNSSINFFTDDSRYIMGDNKNQYIICLRNIFDSKYSTPIGLMVFVFDREIFTRQLAFNVNERGSTFSLIDSVTGKTLFSNSNEVSNRIFSSQLTVSVPIENTDWVLNGYYGTNLFYKELLLIVGSIILAVLLAILISKKMWKTLEKEIVTPIDEVSDGLALLIESEGDPSSLMIVDKEEERETEVYHLIENYNSMLKKIDYLVETNSKKQIDIEKTEFLALQRQINPHFLYNTIGTIRWMAILQGADNIKDYSEKLVHLLRNIAQAKENNTVGDEVDCMKDFIEIQSLAYHYSFQTEYSFPENWDVIKKVPCVRFILQPIVENAIVHGLGIKSESDGYLKISVYSKTYPFGDTVELSVFDNGVGMDSDEIRGNIMSGIGISNVQERIVRAYGKNYGVKVESLKGEFTEFLIRIPFTKGANK